MKYDILLFDADNTILDFDKAEEQALRSAFAKYNLSFDNNVLQVYRKHNIRQWQLFEQGKQTKDEVLINRFVETFNELNIVNGLEEVSNLYESNLHNGYFIVDNALEVLKELHSFSRLYLVSNGVLSIQNSRMKGSGLDKYFIKRFVSEEVGYPKPQKEYFEYCFSNIENLDKTKTLIIGDSLTSDIQGGINAGIDTCWYNPKHTKNQTSFLPTYQIDDLRKLLKIVC